MNLHETYETAQPWIIYSYGRTHDGWWPLWTSTRVLGRARIGMRCIVCGHREVASLRIPRFGHVREPESGKHPAREGFLSKHAHPDRGHPMSWAQPLANPAVHAGGMNLDMLAMRLEADISHADLIERGELGG